MLKRVVLLAAGLGLVAVACGSGEDAAVASVDDIEGSPTSTVASLGGSSGTEDEMDDGEQVTTEQALLDLAACMRDEGVDMDDPQIDADGNFRLGQVIRQASDADPEDIRTALNACSEYLEGVTLGFADFDLTELQDQMLEFAACMRANGFDMPDPDFSNFGPRGTGAGGEGPGEGPFGEIDTRDPQYQAAFTACQDILSFGRFGGGGAGRGGSG